MNEENDPPSSFLPVAEYFHLNGYADKNNVCNHFKILVAIYYCPFTIKLTYT